MKRIFTTVIVVCMMLIASIAWSDIIRVPSDQPTIQAGIDAAVNGDTVLVADGVYTGDGNKNLDFNGKAITVTSENGAEYCIIDCENSGRGFYFHNGEGEYSVVSGFTITNAKVSNGGGVYCEYSSSPTITNCTITGNTAIHGAGIGCWVSSPTITSCTITDNIADSTGGGISFASSSSSPTTPTITNCTITGNIADSTGGGIVCYDHSSPAITNCTIADNTAANYGGGIRCNYYCFPAITNCTITGNTAIQGGGIGCYYSSPTITNCIFWDDSPEEIYVSDDGNPVVRYSDIQDGWPGEGNIDADPLFGNPVSGLAYDLQSESPCLNAGTLTGAPSTDIIGRPRPNPPDSNPDMGAYEQNADASLAVELSLFTASTSTDSITINWRTESETNNLGFNIYRSVTKDGKYTKVNARLIQGVGTDATPHDYSFTDENVKLGQTYYYYIEDVDFTGETNKSDIIEVTVGKQGIKTQLVPPTFALLQNYPNPFNPETWIPFKLAQNASVAIRIYSAKGQLVRTITLGGQKAGVYVTKDKAAYWDGRDSLGENVASGVYFYTLQAGEFRATRKMVILK